MLDRFEADAGKLRLEVRVAGPKLRTLAAKGRVKLRITVRFTPRGGAPQASVRRIGLRAGGV